MKTISWAFVRKKYEIIETKNESWSEVNSIIIVCPECKVPFASSKLHSIFSEEPLTINRSLTCP